MFQLFLSVGFLAAMLAVSEAGFRWARHSSAGMNAETKSSIQSAETAILGVLALLLGFTMAMSVSRFDTRRHLVLEEANAIGTSYLRAQLIPAPEGPELTRLIRSYVSSRLEYAKTLNVERIAAARRDTERLQQQIWAQANSFVQKDVHSIPAGLLLQSLNETFDLDAARWTALASHVPRSVTFLDAIIAMLAILFVGYGFGLAGARNVLSIFILSAAITAVLSVVVDLDQPRQGLIQVSQQPMLDLQQHLSGR
jgi:hypothetical protein